MFAALYDCLQGMIAQGGVMAVGVVNVPAVQQHRGKSFGVSAVPYRPPMVFSATLERQ